MLKTLLCPILEDEGLTRDLGDPEARILVEWLVERAEKSLAADPAQALLVVVGLCRRARSIRRFVSLWAQPKTRAAANQFAASERFPWPLPAGDIDPCDLMQNILDCEGDLLDRQAKW